MSNNRRQYRVLGPLPRNDEFVVTDLTTMDRVSIDTDSRDSSVIDDDTEVRPGNLISAHVKTSNDTSRIHSISVESETVFVFQRGITNLFEDALDAWEEAKRKGSAMNSRVTYSTEREPNGAIYVFAEQTGTDLFAQFRDGSRPIDPLLSQIDKPEPYEVFIFDPASHRFILIYIVFEKGSLLANTVRDTYINQAEAGHSLIDQFTGPNDT
ncbi:MAG: DUF6663 family protein [Halobacteriaceae archaeon]